MKFYPVLFLAAAFALSACSSTPNYKTIYAGAQIGDPLRVPPDLNQPVDNESSDAVTSFSDYQKSRDAMDNGHVLKEFQGMSFVRDGSEFWLDIHDSPTDVWNSLQQFFTQLGFSIVSEQPSLGLMQTNYKQNLANIPSNWFLKMIHKLSSTGIMDSYRAHLEYDADKHITRVFIAHQGLREVSDSSKSDIQVGSSKWVVRPSDPELETEMLMRFMAFRGMGEKQAKKTIAETKPVIKATLQQTPAGYVLQYNDSFARVWRLAGIALDRMGIQIDDRNRSAGIYYLQLPDTFQLDGKTGYLSGSNKPSQSKYLLSLVDKGNSTLISVKPRGNVGKDFEQVSKKILSELKDNLQ